MPQDNNIQQKLQQLENQQLPDLSQMDKHWESMQAILQPAVIASKPIIRVSEFLYVLVGVATIIAAIFFFQKENHDNQDLLVNTRPITSKDKIASGKDNQVDSANNSSGSQFNINSLRLKPQTTFTPMYDDVYFSTGDTLTGDDFFKDSTLVEDENTQRQLLLTDLFKGLSKPAQRFSIDNKKDTLLLCKEGTVVMVPANSFAGEDSIDFEITEFYEYSDMVLNRLTTMSDTSQLISGGMLRINAYRNDSLIDVKLEKSLKVFVPRLTENDSMQIFKEKENTEGDSVVGSNVNWTLSDTRMSEPLLRKYIRAIDFNDYYNLIRGYESASRKKAVFSISKETDLSREQIRNIMREKYPEYDRMRFKKIWRRNLLFKKANDEFEENYGIHGYPGLGDTSYFEINHFFRYKSKHTPIDTIYSNGSWSVGQNRSFFNIETDIAAKKIAEKYSFLLDDLGWINCDRFYNDPRQKTNLFVKVADDPGNYFTVIVFDKFKSIMNGYPTFGGRVSFSKIPVGEAVKIISIGINAEGKAVMAMKEIVIKKDEVIKLDYEEQEKDDIKKSLSILNK
jgi:hypothetical protein